MQTESHPQELDWLPEARRMAESIRLRVLEHVLRNDGGYMSQACSTAEIFAALYTRVLHIGASVAPLVPRPFGDVPGVDPDYMSGGGYNGPRLPHFDRFIFSPAHYALVLYTALIESGRMAPDALTQFNQDGSRVEMIGAEHSPGVETTTGSLGQAISQAGGIALARRLKGESGRVWVMMSDGEFQEGQTWEAVQALAHYSLDSVAVIVDANGQQCDGAMQSVMKIEPLEARLRAFGAAVAEVDGHDLEALASACDQRHRGAPLFVLARTDPCRGLELMRSRAPKLHYLRFKDRDERQRYQEVLNSWRQA